jgi:ankyrin repeat protein
MKSLALILKFFLLSSSSYMFCANHDLQKTRELRQYLNELTSTIQNRRITLSKMILIILLKKVKECVEQGANPNISDDLKGVYAIHLAAEAGDVNLIRVLFSHGSNIEMANKNSETPLRKAISFGHQKAITELIVLGANLEARDKNGWTPLLLAATKGNLAVVAELIALGVNIEARSNAKGETALIFAVTFGHHAVVAQLIDSGANIEERSNVYGWTPLIFAARNGYSRIVALLIGARANIEAVDRDGETPLIFAINNYSYRTAVRGKNYQGVIDQLIGAGANIEASDCEDRTSLISATKKGCLGLVAQFINLGANIEAREIYGWTPLIIAAKKGFLEIVKQLIGASADIEAKSNSYQAPLTYAAKEGHLKIVRELIGARANVEAVDKNGWTPLIFAAKDNHFEVVVELIHSGANADHQSNSGYSAETLAKGESKKMLSEFFSKQAILPGEYSLHRAIRLKSNDELKQILINSSQASPNPLINQIYAYKLTLLDIALVTRNVEAISLLLSHGANPLICRFNGIKLASHILEWQNPITSENGQQPSLYNQIYAVHFNHYLSILLPLSKPPGVPMEIIRYIIKLVLILS